jgi:hypothetical protein
MVVLQRKYRERSRASTKHASSWRRATNILSTALVCLAIGPAAKCQQSAPEDTMRARYEATEKAQAAGDLAQAEIEYKKFVSDALRRLASLAC